MINRAPSEKQAAARGRNWGIRNLRALYAQAFQLSPVNRAVVQSVIDAELVQRGALPTDQHEAAKVAKAMKKLPKSDGRCPFCRAELDVCDCIPF